MQPDFFLCGATLHGKRGKYLGTGCGSLTFFHPISLLPAFQSPRILLHLLLPSSIVICTACSIFEHFQIGIERLSHFADADIFIGRVGTKRLAGTELERLPRHERLVAERRGAVGLEAETDAALDERVPGIDM